MLEIKFTTKSEDKANALYGCLKESVNKDTGCEFSLYEDRSGDPVWEFSLSVPGRIRDAAAVIDIDACPGALSLYTELKGKASADAMLAGIAVKHVDELQ